MEEEASAPSEFNLKAVAAYVRPLLDAKHDVTCDVAYALRILKNVRMLHLELKPEDKESINDIEVVEIAAILWPLYKYELKAGEKNNNFILQLRKWTTLFPASKLRVGALIFLLERCSIEDHEKESKEDSNPTIPQELKLLRDAVKIGALGFIGNYLAFATAAKEGRPAVLPSTPTIHEWIERGSPRLDDDGSLVGKFYAQTLHLPFMMYHHRAKELTSPLIAPMLKFLNALVEESHNSLF